MLNEAYGDLAGKSIRPKSIIQMVPGPESNRYKAIAEWPTLSGPVDYALFHGKTLVGLIEAKKTSVDVPGVLTQAKAIHPILVFMITANLRSARLGLIITRPFSSQLMAGPTHPPKVT